MRDLNLGEENGRPRLLSRWEERAARRGQKLKARGLSLNRLEKELKANKNTRCSAGARPPLPLSAEDKPRRYEIAKKRELSDRPAALTYPAGRSKDLHYM